MGNGSLIALSSSVGYSWNDRNYGKQAGMEVDGSVSYKIPFGVNLTGSGRGILTESSFTRWKIESAVEYDRGNDKRGAVFNVSPSWEQSLADNSKTTSGRRLAGSIVSTNGNEYGVDAKIGYGIGILNDAWLVTPYSEYDSFRMDRKYALGAEFSSGAGVNVKLVWPVCCWMPIRTSRLAFQEVATDSRIFSKKNGGNLNSNVK